MITIERAAAKAANDWYYIIGASVGPVWSTEWDRSSYSDWLRAGGVDNGAARAEYASVFAREVNALLARDALWERARSLSTAPWGVARQILRDACGLPIRQGVPRGIPRYDLSPVELALWGADSEERAAYSSTAAAEGLTVAAWARREIAAWLAEYWGVPR